MEYLNLSLSDLDSKIKEGDMFFCEISRINAIKLVPITKAYTDEYPDYNSRFFQYNFCPIYEHGSKLKNDPITILKYVGDNKFIEYYTELPIFIYPALEVVKAFENYSKFMDKYNQYLISPLFVNNLIARDDIEAQCKFGSQKEQEIAIKILITELYKESLENLKISFENMISQDQDYATGENMIRNFTKTETPKR